jgi:hypothetical protein
MAARAYLFCLFETPLWILHFIGKGVWRQMIITSHFLTGPLGTSVNGDEFMLTEDFNGVLGGLNLLGRSVTPEVLFEKMVFDIGEAAFNFSDTLGVEKLLFNHNDSFCLTGRPKKAACRIHGGEIG